jgi:hypothetical protein
VGRVGGAASIVLFFLFLLDRKQDKRRVRADTDALKKKALSEKKKNVAERVAAGTADPTPSR